MAPRKSPKATPQASSGAFKPLRHSERVLSIRTGKENQDASVQTSSRTPTTMHDLPFRPHESSPDAETLDEQQSSSEADAVSLAVTGAKRKRNQSPGAPTTNQRRKTDNHHVDDQADGGGLDEPMILSSDEGLESEGQRLYDEKRPDLREKVESALFARNERQGEDDWEDVDEDDEDENGEYDEDYEPGEDEGFNKEDEYCKEDTSYEYNEQDEVGPEERSTEVNAQTSRYASSTMASEGQKLFEELLFLVQTQQDLADRTKRLRDCQDERLAARKKTTNYIRDNLASLYERDRSRNFRTEFHLISDVHVAMEQVQHSRMDERRYTMEMLQFQVAIPELEVQIEASKAELSLIGPVQKHGPALRYLTEQDGFWAAWAPLQAEFLNF